MTRERQRPLVVAEPDTRTSMQRCEDVVFENRIKVLTEKGRFQEIDATLLIYASILTDREEEADD